MPSARRRGVWLGINLLTVFLAFQFQAWRRQSVKLVVLAAVVLIPLLACWHLSQFLVLVITLSVAVARTIAAPGEKPAAAWIPFPVLMPAIYTLAGLAAGFINVNAGGGSLLTLPALIFNHILVLG